MVRFKLNVNEKFSPQIKDFCCTVDDLKEIVITLNDDLLSILLLCDLPDQLESFVVAIKSRDSFPKYENLISKILEKFCVKEAKSDFKINKKNMPNNSNNRNAYNNKHMQYKANEKKNLNCNATLNVIELEKRYIYDLSVKTMAEKMTLLVQ